MEIFDPHIDTGKAMARRDIWRKLVNRQHLFKAIQAAPEVLQLEVKRPVFILGLQCSGNSQLYRIMAEDSRFRAPHPFEMLFSEDESASDLQTDDKGDKEDQKENEDQEEDDQEANDYSNAHPRLRKACITWQCINR